MTISPKPTSGKSARFHLFEYRLVTGITSGLPITRPESEIGQSGFCVANASMALMDFRKPRYWWMCSDLLSIFNL